MFDRNIESYHDKQILSPGDVARFSDEFTAKYLYSCYNPDIPMRVRERSKPVLPPHACAVGGSKRRFTKREEVI